MARIRPSTRLLAQPAGVSGVGGSIRTGSGAAQAQSATVSGAGTAGNVPGFTWTMPSLQDERDFYDNILSWSRLTADETFTQWANTPSLAGFGNIHGDTEGDDLWTWLHQVTRYGAGYAVGSSTVGAWRDEWLSEYQNNLVASLSADDGFDDPSGYGFDHAYGQGLALHYQQTGNSTTLATLTSLRALIESVPEYQTLDGASPIAMCFWEGRWAGRWGIIGAYAYEATGQAAWQAIRDNFVYGFTTATDWEEGGVIAAGGLMFASRAASAYLSGFGDPPDDTAARNAAYDAGRRIHSTFQVGLIAEAMWRLYLQTGNATLRSRLISIARYVQHYMYNPAWEYPNVGSRFGHDTDGSHFHIFGGSAANANNAADDPSYDISLINTLIYGFRLTGEISFLEKARYVYTRGNRYATGSPFALQAPDTSSVNQFADTVANPDDIYFEWNKGQLQYCAELFRDGGTGGSPESSLSALATLARNTAPGDWALLTSVSNTDALLDPRPGGNGNIFPYAENLIWDPVTKRAYFRNSDDPGDYRRHAAYDEATNAWIVINDEVFPPEDQVNHIYDSQSFDPVNRRIYFGQGASSAIGYYDIDLDQDVSDGSVTGASGDPTATATCYFPERAALYHLRDGNLYTRPDGGSWSTLTPIISTFHQVLQYNPWHQCIIAGGGNNANLDLYRINADGSVDALGDPPFGIDCVRTEWITNPKTGDFWVLHKTEFPAGTRNWYRFNPTTDIWTDMVFTSLPAQVQTDLCPDNYTPDQLLTLACVIPEHNIALYVSRGILSGQTHWVYKFAEGPTT